MARKTSDTIQTNLRLKEALRRRVAREAKRNQVSMTKQILLFIEDGLERQDRITLAEIARDMTLILAQQATAHHEANILGDAVRALEGLIQALPADARESGNVGKAVAKARQVLKMVDAEAAAGLRRMHTTGGSTA